ncbi:MAG: carbohydrate ABC transporter permease [Micrococcales bacterium]|jgi:cellobiose transport system permease protein|nr:carbohydrate ABC transporter permease [Microbacteriaceae bacterium]NBR22928.1 carbohydrate ABC transporter permease [Micrococcales bacterium]NBX94365.1 carbohydrate ABC transporter permease [Actinomycetota bacterium]NBR77379.1 carbohydrate ABC transporter permease [Microbacteriaceae bacterium]NBS61027.1 carbohydrate ABC transporter permease [Microbacteriaceae bacterium]
MSSVVKEQTIPRAKVNKRPKWQRMGVGGYIVLALTTFLSIFPFYWMFIVASNGTDEISKIPPTLVPGPRFFTVISNVYEVLPSFNQALLNTVYVGTIVAVAQVFFSAIAGFAFAKLNFRGQRFMVLFVILTMMLPSQLGIIPLFMLMGNLGLIDTLGALIVPALVTAFGVFWMRQVIDAQVPNELLESASIDGAGVFRVYWSLVLPIIAQSSFVLGLFSFLATWNDFLWPLLVLSTPEHFTAQVAVNQLKSSYAIDYALNMGGAFLSTAPLIVLFIFVGRRLVRGVMDGAVKG